MAHVAEHPALGMLPSSPWRPGMARLIRLTRPDECSESGEPVSQGAPICRKCGAETLTVIFGGVRWSGGRRTPLSDRTAYVLIVAGIILFLFSHWLGN